MRKWILISLAGLVVLIGCFAATVSVVAQSAPAHATPEQVTDLSGTWQDDKSQFVATVTGGTVNITWHPDADTSGLYWQGSFVITSVERTGGMLHITSFAEAKDEEALKGSLYGSQDTTKTFTYDDHKLSFNFTIMGVTKTIYLHK